MAGTRPPPVDADAPLPPSARPDLGEAELAELVDRLRARVVTTGPATRQFDAQFAARHGGGVLAVAVNARGTGLPLARGARGAGPGITGWAAIEVRAETTLRAGAADPDRADIGAIAPVTLARRQRHARERTMGGELHTLMALLR